MQQPPAGYSLAGFDYLDSIWNARQLPWQVREHLLTLHQQGILEAGELTLEALERLANSGLDANEAFHVLGAFRRRVNTPQEQRTTEGKPAGWKCSILLELLRDQVLHCWRVATDVLLHHARDMPCRRGQLVDSRWWRCGCRAWRLHSCFCRSTAHE
jgi:hypothetical protein